MTQRDDGGGGGILSRWSRRKAEARAGAVASDPPAPLPATVAPLPAIPAATTAPPAPDATVPPPPTLEDVSRLGPDDDYARFVAPGVDESVKRAAMKKLFFTDPRFNVMDGLDVYIDDYGTPDPLPESMLRRLVQSRALGLFDEGGKNPDAAVPDGAAAPSLRQSPVPSPLPAPDLPDEDTALRLQQDDAADAAGPGADRTDPRA